MRSVWVVVVAAACSNEPGGIEPVTSGAYHQYVTTGLRIPVSAELQREYGLNIDGDAAGRPDNQLGNVFVALSSNSDADLQGRVDAAIARGEVLMLHSIRADQLANDRSVSWQVYVGEPGGGEPYAITDHVSEPMIGRTSDGSYEALASGRLAVQLAVSEDAPPIALDLIATRVEATIDEAGCAGRLGGAVTERDVHDVLIPSVVEMMNAAIARDPGCPAACMAGTSAALIIEVFDTNMDGTVTTTELEESSIIQTLLSPDVDLLDETGARGRDGIEDSISLGVEFDCEPVTFQEAR